MTATGRVRVLSVSTALLAATIFGSCGSDTESHEESVVRHFEGGVFTSSDHPPLSVHLGEEIEYLGATQFVLMDAAEVDRHHFVKRDANGGVEALVVLHFEAYLPGIDGAYEFNIPEEADRAGPNYRFSPEYVALGENEYRHNTWFFDARADVNENPGRELDHTERLLQEHGLTLPDELRMSRYARAVGPEAKREIILFYLEPLEPTGLSLSEFVDGGRGEAVFDSLSAELTARSGHLFDVIDG